MAESLKDEIEKLIDRNKPVSVLTLRRLLGQVVEMEEAVRRYGSTVLEVQAAIGDDYEGSLADEVRRLKADSEQLHDGHDAAVQKCLEDVASDNQKMLDELIDQRDRAEKARDEALSGRRFILTRDNDSHWYVVPADKRAEWNAWCDIPEDDERAWQAPDFAQEVGGAPSRVTFTNPVIA